MGIFRGRFVSSKDFFYALAACSFPVFLWAFYKIFLQTPAMIIKMSLLDALSVDAYALAAALLESVVLSLFLVIVAAVIPEKFLRKKFVPHTMGWILVTAAWAAYGQINYQTVYDSTFVELLPWLLMYLGSCVLIYLLIQRYERLSRLIYRFVQGISVLATLYISLGMIGLLVVVLRNL